ncbi:MAG TPA: IclR family transcriptional regulator [Steroidobacteraceae bacterium]|jgi:DNA-binding IclR family transcriptional regulator|nr:IclR family transcriptional regulator [Steroidobacteraceae bacterium]
MKQALERSGIQVIARAAAVLRSLEQEPNGLSLGEIAKRVRLPRSTVQRIVAALGQEQLLVSATSQARVKLGPALVLLGAAADVGTEKTVRPIMQQLARLADETVDLSILQTDSAVFVEQIQGTQRLVAVSAVGKAFPLHCTANGKALLALLAPERRASLLMGRLKRYTQATKTERSALEADLRQVEASNLALDLEEHSRGICAIGTAFRDSLGREFSLSIPVPAARFARKRQHLSKLLKKARADLLARLNVFGTPLS